MPHRGAAYIQSRLMRPIQLHEEQIYADIKALGAVWYDMRSPVTQSLLEIVLPEERIKGVVYGHYKQKHGYGQEASAVNGGKGMLVVTDKRIIYIDRKLPLLKFDEISGNIVRIAYTKAGFARKVALYTKADNFTIRTFNRRSAKTFVEAIEAICSEQEDTQ